MICLCDGCKHAEQCPAKAEHGGALRCSAYKPQEVTNEEFLRSCTTEQLAEWLQEHMECASCGCNKDLCYQGYDCCKLAFVEWLKEVHNDGKH